MGLQQVKNIEDPIKPDGDAVGLQGEDTATSLRYRPN